MGTESTRERILDTALTLFNEAGTAAVSTNHIAAALGIGPGNLYYYFRNKQAIIRELFERQFDQNDRLYALVDAQSLALADLQRLARATFQVTWQFRFIYRELIALLRRDPDLRARWLEVRARGYTGFHELVNAFVAAGVFRSLSPDVVERLADLCWLISEFWLASIEVSGLPVDEKQMERGVALMLQVLEPFIIAEPRAT